MNLIDQIKLIKKNKNLTIIYEANSYYEQESLAQDFFNMSDEQRNQSDKESIKIFGENNMDRNDRYMEKYAKEGIYIEKIKQHYNEEMQSYGLSLIHLSLDDKPKLMKPRIPVNKLTKSGVENNTIPRICFAQSIFGALSAIQFGRTGDELYVHVPINPQKVLYSKDIVKYVADAKNTSECWILDEKLFTNVVGKIVVGQPYGIIDTYSFNNGDKQYTYYYDYIFYPNEQKLKNRIMNILDTFI